MNKVKIELFSGKRPDKVKLLNTLSTYNVKCFKVQEVTFRCFFYCGVILIKMSIYYFPMFVRVL